MNINKQLFRTYSYAFFAYCGITQLWVIYLSQVGLSLVQIGLCESIFHIASFLFEIPSGVLADRFTYRGMLAFSRLAALAAAAMMLLHGGFIWFALSFVISAWSYNLQSGTLETLLFESLQEHGRASYYAEATSRMNAVIEVSSTGGLLIAGTISHHLAYSYVIAVGLALLALLTVARLREPRQHSSQKARQTMKHVLTAAWGVLRHDRGLFALILYDAFFSALTTGFFYYFQNVMETRHFAGWLITLALAGASLASLAAIRLAPRLLKTGKRRLLLGLAGGLTITFLLAWANASWLLTALYLLNYALSAMIPPLFNVYYNDRIPSGQRATLLSVASLIFSFAMIGLFPLLGWLIGVIGFGATIGSIGLLLAVVVVAAAATRRLA